MKSVLNVTLSAMQQIPYKYVDGHCVNAFYNDDLVRSALNYKPEPGDVFIATYPKCGTTWVQFVVYGIFHGGCFPKDSLEFALASPYLEFLGAEAASRMPRPGAMKTHMPFHRVPYSKDAKYITVARNPFDVCVSFYYHTTQNTTYDVTGISFDDYLDNFVRGAVPFGDYFDHLLSWYEHRHDTNVLFLTYEGLKADTRAAILKIADFLDSEYGNMLRTSDGLMKKLLEGSDFRNMQAIVDSGGSVLHRLLDLPPERALKSLEVFRQSLGPPNKNEVRYLRKGIVGDWRNHFSEEQAERMKKRIREKCANTDVMKLWDGLRLPY